MSRASCGSLAHPCIYAVGPTVVPGDVFEAPSCLGWKQSGVITASLWLVLRNALLFREDLKGRAIEREKEARESLRPLVYSQMVTTARAGPGQSQ